MLYSKFENVVAKGVIAHYYTPDKRSLEGIYWSRPVVGWSVGRLVGPLQFSLSGA